MLALKRNRMNLSTCYRREHLYSQSGRRFDTMLEQVNIRKAELTKRLLDRKTKESSLDEILSDKKNSMTVLRLR